MYFTRSAGAVSVTGIEKVKKHKINCRFLKKIPCFPPENVANSVFLCYGSQGLEYRRKEADL